jgi:hypothetical protein
MRSGERYWAEPHRRVRYIGCRSDAEAALAVVAVPRASGADQ